MERTRHRGFSVVTLGKIAVPVLVTCTSVPVATDMHTVTTADEHIRSSDRVRLTSRKEPSGGGVLCTSRPSAYRRRWTRRDAAVLNIDMAPPDKHDVVRLIGRRRGGDVDDRRP